MRKQTTHKFAGMDKDTPFAQRSQDTYWEAHNIKLVNNGATKSATKHEGFEEMFSLLRMEEDYIASTNTTQIDYYDFINDKSADPLVIRSVNNERQSKSHTDLNIVGLSELNDEMIIFAVSKQKMTFIFSYYKNDTNASRNGFKLYYANYMGMGYDDKIEIISNYENSAIQKLYWIDGVNQLRHINLADPDVGLVLPDLLNLVSAVEFTQPILQELITADGQIGGKVQYCFSLYNLSGAETRISPFSKFTSLIDPETLKGGGPGLGDKVGAAPIYHDDIKVSVGVTMRIPQIDDSFDFIRIYVIKYTEPNVEPTIRLIIDEKITAYDNYVFTDDGSKKIGDPLSLITLLDKGGDLIVPQTMETNKNKLFLANYLRKSISTDLDCRAFSYAQGMPTTTVYGDKAKRLPNPIKSTNSMPKLNHSCWNDIEGVQYQKLSEELGATGKNIIFKVRKKDVIQKVVIGSTIVLEPIYENPTEGEIISLDVWDAARNILVNDAGDDIVNSAFTEAYAQTITRGTIFNVSVAGSQQLHPSADLQSFKVGDQVQILPGVKPDGSGGTISDNSYDKVPQVEINTYGDRRVDQSFKRGELYRFAIEFYDKFGEVTDAKWICDYRFPYTTTLKQTYSIDVSLSKLAIKQLKEDNLVAFKVLMVERTAKDMSITSQGVINPTMEFYSDYNVKTPDWKTVLSGKPPASDDTVHKLSPYYLNKDYTSTKGGRIAVNIDDGIDYHLGESFKVWCPTWLNPFKVCRSHRKGRQPAARYDAATIVSPEITFGKTLPKATTLRILGYADATDKTYTHSQDAENVEPKPLTPLQTVKGMVFDDYMKQGADDEADNKGTYQGFNRVYGELTIPKSRVFGVTRVYSNSVPLKKLGKSDVELEHVISIIDYNRSKTIKGIPFTAKGTIPGFIPGGDAGADGKRDLDTIYNSYGALLFKDAEWSRSTKTDGYYQKFVMEPEKNIRRIPIGELIVELENQYGGSTHAIRQRNNYVPIGTLATIQDTSTYSTGLGDVYIAPFKYLRNTSDLEKSKDGVYTDEWITVTIESTVNLKTRYGVLSPEFDDLYIANEIAVFKNATSPGTRGNRRVECQLYNDVYDMANTTIVNFSIPDTFRQVDKFPTTVIASTTKINNEVTDNWLRFSTDNILTLPSKYGEIMSLNLATEQLISFQRSGIAYISVDPRVQVTAADGGSIGLGSGSSLQDYRYFTTTSGSIHKWSIINTKSGVFYFDYNNRSVNLLGEPETEITTTSGINKYLWDYIEANTSLEYNANKIYNTIAFHYDNKSENIYLTFSGKEALTISYNTLLTVPVSFHDFTPSSYYNYQGYMHMVGKSGLDRIKENHYLNSDGSEYDMSVTVLNTEAAQLIKRFDNLEVDSDANFNTIQCTNSYQDTGIQPFKGKLSVLRKRMVLPRAKKRQRLRDDHLFITLTHKGNSQINFEYLAIAYNIDKTYFLSEN